MEELHFLKEGRLGEEQFGDGSESSYSEKH